MPQAVEVEQVMGAFFRPCSQHVLDLQAEDHVVVDGTPFKEFIVLKHVAYVCRAFFMVFSVDLDIALFRFDEPGDQREQGRFADGIAVETNGAVLTKSAKVFGGMFEDKAKLEQSISTRIRYCMQKAKVPQYKIARAIGYANETISNYMNGKIPEEHMNVHMLKKMAVYLGMDKYYFCNEYHKFMDSTDVPKFLKEMRREKGMSQREFASAADIPLQSYKKYEEGWVRLPEKYWRTLMDMEKG